MAGFSGVLELSGVWPQSTPITAQAGFIGAGDLAGTWIRAAPPNITVAGYSGHLSLSGLWITGSNSSEPRVRGGGRRNLKYENEEILEIVAILMIKGWI